MRKAEQKTNYCPRRHNDPQRKGLANAQNDIKHAVGSQ